jgi:hypothetical protein
VKEAELRAAARCANCGKLLGETKMPLLFWRIRIERFGIDTRAIQRQDGLATFLGSRAIARVMGPDEDLAKPMMEPVTITLCEPCGSGEAVYIAVLGLPE